MKHLVAIHDLSAGDISSIYARARAIKMRGARQILTGNIVAMLFYEPSTRTRLSFESAALRLGAQVIGTENAAKFSSAIKGESLADTIRIVGGYCDAIVLRHPDNDAAEVAAKVSSVPIINAGNGTGEHPTQALLDLFTILEYCGGKQKLVVSFAGDLLNGRTVHSLVMLLQRTALGLPSDLNLRFMAPSPLQLPSHYLQAETLKHTRWRDALDTDIMADADVLYMTRTQIERGSSGTESSWVLTPQLAAALPRRAIIMHPLPRNSELPPEIDSDPRAKYFEQAKNGLYIRMALLEHLLGNQ